MIDLNKSENRADLIRAGLSGKMIEKAWLNQNNIKLLNNPILMENL